MRDERIATLEAQKASIWEQYQAAEARVKELQHEAHSWKGALDISNQKLLELMRDLWFDKAKVLAYCVRSEEVWPPWEQCLPGESPVDEIAHALKAAFDWGYAAGYDAGRPDLSWLKTELESWYESQRPVNESLKR